MLRHDPDVILIGEMRDVESISIALTAAETGHLVLSTLHTQTAPLAVHRIIDVFQEHMQNQVRQQLADALQGIISQRLLPHPDGQGMSMAAEVLLANSAVRNMIRDEKEYQLYTVIQTGHKQGMRTMDQALAELYMEGKITKEMALTRSVSQPELERLLGKSIIPERCEPMGLYSYEVVDRIGRSGSGQMAADDEMIVAEKLRNMGLTVLDINEVRQSSFSTLFKRKPKVGIGDLALFTRQLQTLLEAGVPLTRALYTLSNQVANRGLGEVLGEVAQLVDSGMSFSDSLSNHPDVFPSLFVNMVRSGEASGNLDEILKQLAGQMEREKSLRDNIKSATFYPIVVLVFALIVVLAMLIFIVPVFLNMFPPGMALPLPTRIVMGISDSIFNYWYLYIIVTIAIVYGVRYYLRTPSGSRAWDKIRFKLPAFGPLLYRTVMARFTNVMATLLSGGIPALQALETAGPASGSIMVAEAVEKTSEKIQEGKNLADPLGESGVFPPMVVQMVAVGEESGNLPEMLSRVSGFYDEEVATMSKGLASVIEPLLIIVVGYIVGFMVISMYLPMFIATTSVGG